MDLMVNNTLMSVDLTKVTDEQLTVLESVFGRAFIRGENNSRRSPTNSMVAPQLATPLISTDECLKAMLEQERLWMVLRKTDTSKTVATSNTWQSAIDLSTFTRFASTAANPSAASTGAPALSAIVRYRLTTRWVRLLVHGEHTMAKKTNGTKPAWSKAHERELKGHSRAKRR
jgi:hypothetical protein